MIGQFKQMTDNIHSREEVDGGACEGISDVPSPQNIMIIDQVHLNVIDDPVKAEDARINVTKNISFGSKSNANVLRCQAKRGRGREIGGRQNRHFSQNRLENRKRGSSEFGDCHRPVGSRMGRGTSVRGRGRGSYDMRSLHMNPNQGGRHPRFGSMGPARGLPPREIPPPPPAPSTFRGHFSTPDGNCGRGSNQLQTNQSVSKYASLGYQDVSRQHQQIPNQQQQSLPLQHSFYPPRDMISNLNYHPNSGGVTPQSLNGYYQLQQSQRVEDTQNEMNSPNSIATNWSVHKAPTGVDYYYNSVTRLSTYRRPSCLGVESNNSSRGDNSSLKWTKHVDPKSGKTYYFNGVSTTWNNPFDFEDRALLKNESDIQSPTKKRKTEKNDDIHFTYNNKEEAVAVFKCLLLEKGIIPNLKWNEVQKMCCVDRRWQALKTIGERKQALAEYQTKRANDLKEEKRQERIRAKDGFMQMLTEKLPSIASFNGKETRFEDIRDHLVRDERFGSVDQERDREDFYEEFISEVRKRDERKRDGLKRQEKASFVSFLEDREKMGALSYSSTWSHFISSLSEDEKKDTRFSESSTICDSEKQDIFEEFIKKMKDTERERLKHMHDTKIKLERAQRDEFVKALTRLAKESKILPFSRWRNCEEFLSAEKAYGPVRDQDMNTPRDLFESFVDEWYTKYRRDRLFLHDIAVPSKLLTNGTSTNYSEFTKNLIDASQSSSNAYLHVRHILNLQEPVSSAKLLFDELISKLQKGPYGRRMKDDSSESEGEIIEDDNDGEIE